MVSMTISQPILFFRPGLPLKVSSHPYSSRCWAGIGPSYRGSNPLPLLHSYVFPEEVLDSLYITDLRYIKIIAVKGYLSLSLLLHSVTVQTVINFIPSTTSYLTSSVRSFPVQELHRPSCSFLYCV